MKPLIRLLTLAGTAALIAVAGPAGAQEMRYHISDIIIGSILPQEIITSNAPIAGRWSELTPEQKAAVASDYENLPAGDEPPYPMYGVRHLLAPVARYAATDRPLGPLVASVVIDAEGKPGQIVVYKSSDQTLTRFVASQLATEEFKPGVCHGQPCEMTYLLRLDFPRRGGQHVSSSSFTDFDPNSHSVDSR